MRQNQKQNEANRQLQLNVIKYQQKMQWLTELKAQLVNYYNSFNQIDLFILGDLVLSRNVKQFDEARVLMKKMCIEKNSSMFSLGIMLPMGLDKKENEFLTKTEKFNLEFNALIEDFDWFILLTSNFFNGDIETCGHYIQKRVDAYKIEQKEERTPEISDNRIAEIMENHNNNIYDNYKSIVAQRMQSIGEIDQVLIQTAISEFIDYEQEKINNILKQSDYPFMHLLYSQLLVCQRVCLQNTVCLICK